MQKKYSFASKRGAPPQTQNLPPQRQPKYMRVTLTTLTQHITSPEYLKSLIDSKAHYQVIPEIPQLLCWDVNSLIAVAVECSRGKVLDIVLPYRLIKPHFYSDYFFGRHIFMNGKLVGIRLATFASGSSVQRYSHSNMLKAPKREVLHVQIWQGLKQIYKQLQIPFQPEETLPVGDFLLEFNNAKFGLLFQSEIDQSRTIISDYYYQGVTVLSVVDDTISHLAKDGNYPVSNNYFIQNLQVQKISNNSDGKLVMCTGVRMVGFDWTYLTIANISTIDNQRSKGSKSMWNDSWWVQTCQLPFYDSQQQSQRLLLTKLMQQPPTITIEEEIPTCSVVGNESGCQMLLDKRNKVKQSTGKQKNDLQPMFRLIYVYKHINKGCRFTVPHNIGHQFYSALLKFGAFADRPLQILIHLYKVQGKEISVAGNALVQIGLKIYSSIEQLVQSMPQEKIYVYTQNQTQLIGLQKLAAKTENVFICGQFPKKIIGKMELPRSSVIKSMDSFVNEAFQQQIFDMQQLLKRVRNSNYRLKIKSQVEAIAFRMKQKLHQCYVLTPFTEYILSSSLEQIKKKLQAAQVSLHNSQEGITQHSRDPERPKDSYPNQIKKKALQVQNFTKILESAIKHKKLNLSQSRMTCHVCKVIFPGDLVYSCEGCRFQICLACIRQALKPTKEMTKTKKTFQYCLVCNNLCQCKDCLNKRLGPNDRTEAIQVESQNCLECKKNGRAFVNIKIECKSCIAKVCWACAKADEEQRIGPGYSYRCKQCTEAQRIKEQRQLDFESLRYTMALIKSNNSIQDFEAVQDRQIQEARPAEKYRDEGPKQEKQTDSHLLAKDQTLQRKIRKTKNRKRSRSNDRRKSPSRQKKRRPSSSSSSSSRSSSSSSSSSESQRSSRNKKMRQSSRNRKKESSNNQRNKSSPKKKRKKSSDSDSSSPPIRQKKLKKIPMLQQILNDLKKFRQGSSQSHDRKKSKKIAKDRDHSQRNQVESRAQSQRANKNSHPTHLRPNFQKKGLWGDRQQVPRLNSLMQANLREKQGMEPGQVQVLPQSGLILPFNRYESKDDIQY